MVPVFLPYASRDELVSRVDQLFNSDIIQTDKKLEWVGLKHPVLYDYESDSRDGGYDADIELLRLMKLLPANHEIITEIHHRAQASLQDILTKSTVDLGVRTPSYLKALEVVGGYGYEELFESVQNAAYHVLNRYPVTADVP